MNKILQMIAIGIVVILVLSSFFIIKNNRNDNKESILASTTDVVFSTSSTKSLGIKNTSGTVSNTTTPNTPASMCNIKIAYPVTGSRVVFPLNISGTIDLDSKYDCTWNNNLSMGGTIQIYYNIKNTGWKASGIPTSLYTSGAAASTSTLVVKATVNMYAEALGLTSGTPIKLVFTELNIKNDSNPKTFSYITYLK